MEGVAIVHREGLAAIRARRQISLMTSPFRDNAAHHRYEIDHAGGPSFATYRDGQGVRAILHVETPAAARGQGHAAKLMEALVADARARQMKLTPICGYAAAWFRRNPAARDVLA